MLFLEVDYDIKDKVKKLGAKWNPVVKKWYVEKKEDYNKFAHYIVKNYEDAIVVKDYIYLVISERSCWKCGKETKVIGLCIPKRTNYINSPLFKWDNGEFDEESDEYNYKKFNFPAEEFEIEDVTDYEIISLGNISTKLLKIVEDKYNYKLKYSKTTKTKEYSNCCQHCDSLQGNYFLFNELDSPFIVTSTEMARNLTFVKFKLKNDFILYGYEPGMLFLSDYTEEEKNNDIEKFSTFVDSRMEIDDIV